MHDTKRRRYGFLPTPLKGLSPTDFVGVIAILLYLGLVFHTLAPSVKQDSKYRNISEVDAPSFNPNESYGVKQACGTTEKNDENVASQNDVICLIHQYADQYGIETDIALRVAKAENELFDEKAINYNTNGTTDGGIYQINSVHNVPDECRLNARCNIQWAMQTMQKQGTTPWYSSKHRWYE
jgi:hypothetical protein